MRVSPPELVSFVLLAYNQESTIREAVEAAFSQQYAALEIILSDDCSNDRTFDIMSQMGAEYKGPHRVVVRQSRTNLGLARHINEVATQVNGAIVVLAAGDDASLPNRVQAIVERFSESDDICAVYSGYLPVTPNGVGPPSGALSQRYTSMVEVLMSGGGVGVGATYAYHRSCFDWPAPLPEWLQSEDRLLPFRAALRGRIAHIDLPLVKYRVTPKLEHSPKRFRKESYNHPLHWNHLRHELEAAHVDGMVSRTEELGLKLLLGVLRVVAPRPDDSRPSIIARRVGFAVLRPIRKLSVLAASTKR